jgi:hypothetical protein
MPVSATRWSECVLSSQKSDALIEKFRSSSILKYGEFGVRYRCSLSSMLTALALLGACSQPRNEIIGEWIINTPRMREQLRSTGVPSIAVEPAVKVFDGGLLVISGDTIVVRLAGGGGEFSYHYSVDNERDGCTNIKVRELQEVHKYCVVNSELVVHDPKTSINAIYKRIAK